MTVILLLGPPWNTRTVARRGVRGWRSSIGKTRPRGGAGSSRGWTRSVCEARKCYAVFCMNGARSRAGSQWMMHDVWHDVDDDDINNYDDTTLVYTDGIKKSLV